MLCRMPSQDIKKNKYIFVGFCRDISQIRHLLFRDSKSILASPAIQASLLIQIGHTHLDQGKKRYKLPLLQTKGKQKMVVVGTKKLTKVLYSYRNTAIGLLEEQRLSGSAQQAICEAKHREFRE